MATNFFFNNFQASQEQLLIEDLVIESIKIYGHDLMYLPRKTGAVDSIFSEDPTREYTQVVGVEMYIKNVEGFAGQGDFLSKFNLQIRDQITFSVARRVFENEVASVFGLIRPREGDLIYFPLNKKIFEIKFVEHEPVFYQLGALQFYDIKCELFEYNNEYFATGIREIDKLMENYSLDLSMFGVLTESGLKIMSEDDYSIIQESYDINENDVMAQNDEIQELADTIIDFSEENPFSEGNY